MKRINLKSPRYVIPLICLPFIIILFSVLRQREANGPHDPALSADSLRSDIAGVSQQIKGQKLQDKLQAFQDRYRKGDGNTAVGSLSEEQQAPAMSGAGYSEKEKRMLDSIESSIKSRYGMDQAAAVPVPKVSYNYRGPKEKHISHGLSQDRALAAAIEAMRPVQSEAAATEKIDAGDPMAIFRAQMAIVDSIGKANDPATRSQLMQEKKRAVNGDSAREVKNLIVSIERGSQGAFNTVRAEQGTPVYIPAMIDQELTAYSGSRIPLRILENIRAGTVTLKKGSLVYGTVSSFSAQRIQISVSSLLSEGGILPVHLELYDLDGLKGLYVPSSAFRDLTRELGSSPLQGMSVAGGGEENRQLMSIMGRVFQSSSGALSRLVRANKAKIRFAAMVYLIDPQQLSLNKLQ